MPITDYSKTVIYVIKCKDDNITEEYVGSTTNFRIRKNHHKSSCYNEKRLQYNCKIYQFIRSHGGWDNFIMIQLEEYPCENKRQAESREEEIRVERKTQLNMRRAFLSEEQQKIYDKIYRETHKENDKIYRETHKEKIQKIKNIWKKNNKEKIREKDKEYCEINKEKIKEYQKKWYEKNKEKINQNQKNKETQKKYREKNREKINERQRQKRAEKKLLNNIHNEPTESN